MDGESVRRRQRHGDGLGWILAARGPAGCSRHLQRAGQKLAKVARGMLGRTKVLGSIAHQPLAINVDR
jgi:hypothetical protein